MLNCFSPPQPPATIPQIVGGLTEFVVALGVLPDLLPSVAPSVLQRLGVAQARAVEPLMAAAASRREDARRSADTLMPTLTALTRCSLDHEGLGAVVRGKVRFLSLSTLALFQRI